MPSPLKLMLLGPDFYKTYGFNSFSILAISVPENKLIYNHLFL